MEVVLMVTVVVRETQCAGATTAGSLVCITIRAMTAVIILPPSQILVLCAMLRYMRNYNGQRCCTPDNPCGEGEGDCDGHGDGGRSDGDRGCKGDLVCGRNNCKKFGSYYHEKDDCCEKPGYQGWGDWSSWSSCDRGYKHRVRY